MLTLPSNKMEGRSAFFIVYAIIQETERFLVFLLNSGGGVAVTGSMQLLNRFK